MAIATAGALLRNGTVTFEWSATYDTVTGVLTLVVTGAGTATLVFTRSNGQQRSFDLTQFAGQGPQAFTNQGLRNRIDQDGTASLDYRVAWTLGD
jgi:hypothetical protein